MKEYLPPWDVGIGPYNASRSKIIFGSEMMKKKATGAPATLSFRVKVANNIWARGWGLLGRKELKKDEGLWIRPCGSVHTLLMRFPVDLIYLDSENHVVKTHTRLKPFKFSAGNRQTHSVLELPEGFLVRSHLAVGDRLVIVPAGKKEVNISLETGPPGKSGDPAVSKKSASRKRHHTTWVRVLFPSPLFVAPLALPIIMFGIGLGLGLRTSLLLVDLTAGNALRAIGRVLGLRKPKGESPPAEEPSANLDGDRKRRGPESFEQTNPDAEEAAVLITSELYEGRLFRVSEKPATIGTGEDCDIRLPAAAGVAEEHARLWWRDGRLMLHHIAPELVTLVGSRKILWTSMEDGDEVAIGPYTLRISVGRQEIQTNEEAAPSEYTLSVPLEQPQLAHAG